ncbi:SirB2 family protein [Brevundimonas sp.]|uniref:SirB2 family protein n=1 Tax=Brevundimonas sp. TaxID=1871086 RepID=UPI002ED7FCD7
MEEFYPQIRTVHIWAVIASGTLFALRGGAFNLLDAAWPKALPVRILSWSIDTILLTAALMLMTVVRQYPFVDAWLTVKVVLLVIYIGLGTVAFRASRGKRTRIAFWVAALAVFGFIVTVARAHHPLGLFSGWIA